MLTKIGLQPTKFHPRQFCLTPDGKYLLVACMDDDIIQVFERNPLTGILTSTDKSLKLKNPVFVGLYNPPAE